MTNSLLINLPRDSHLCCNILIHFSRTLEGGSNQTKHDTVPDMSFQKPRKNTQVAEDGHHNSANDHSIHPVRNRNILRTTPDFGHRIVSKF